VNLISRAFPAPAHLTALVLRAKADLRARAVGLKAKRLEDKNERTAVFLHPTKGFRHINKKRLGLA
jgi:hypothetical protein